MNLIVLITLLLATSLHAANPIIASNVYSGTYGTAFIGFDETTTLNLTGATVPSCVSTTRSVSYASILPSSFTWGTIGSIANSNNCAPVYGDVTNSGGAFQAIGMVSALTNALQSRYIETYIVACDSGTSYWGSITNMSLTFSTSSTSSATNGISVLVTSPAGTTFASNNLVSATAGAITTAYFTGLPAWQLNGIGTNKWTLRLDCQSWQNATNLIYSAEIWKASLQ